MGLSIFEETFGNERNRFGTVSKREASVEHLAAITHAVQAVVDTFRDDAGNRYAVSMSAATEAFTNPDTKRIVVSYKPIYDKGLKVSTACTVMLGLTLHEIGHTLYTFPNMTAFERAFGKPGEVKRGPETQWRNVKQWDQLAYTVLNIGDDARLEARMAVVLPVARDVFPTMLHWVALSVGMVGERLRWKGKNMSMADRVNFAGRAVRYPWTATWSSDAVTREERVWWIEWGAQYKAIADGDSESVVRLVKVGLERLRSAGDVEVEDDEVDGDEPDDDEPDTDEQPDGDEGGHQPTVEDEDDEDDEDEDESEPKGKDKDPFGDDFDKDESEDEDEDEDDDESDDSEDEDDDDDWDDDDDEDSDEDGDEPDEDEDEDGEGDPDDDEDAEDDGDSDGDDGDEDGDEPDEDADDDERDGDEDGDEDSDEDGDDDDGEGEGNPTDDGGDNESEDEADDDEGEPGPRGLDSDDEDDAESDSDEAKDGGDKVGQPDEEDEDDDKEREFPDDFDAHDLKGNVDALNHGESYKDKTDAALLQKALDTEAVTERVKTAEYGSAKVEVRSIAQLAAQQTEYARRYRY